MRSTFEYLIITTKPNFCNFCQKFDVYVLFLAFCTGQLLHTLQDLVIAALN